MDAKLIVRECPEHGEYVTEMAGCPECVLEAYMGTPIRSVHGMMSSSLEALAKRLK